MKFLLLILYNCMKYADIEHITFGVVWSILNKLRKDMEI
jgi:hypothetical protein